MFIIRGARHGHKMSAKQKRLEMQEKELMAHMKKAYNIHKSSNQCSSSTLNSGAITDKAPGEQEKEQISRQATIRPQQGDPECCSERIQF